MSLSVVVPAYNEARRILPTLQAIFAYLERTEPDFEVIVVDDGSTDATYDLVQRTFGSRPQLRLIRSGTNRGKGYAVRRGTHEASGDWVLFSDADLSTPIEELEKMRPWMAQNFDLILGSRAHPEAKILRRQRWFREASGKLFNVFVRLVVGLPFRDTQCGFKLFRRERMLEVFDLCVVDRFAFDVEIIALALAMGRKVAEVPVVWENSPYSTVSFWRGVEAYAELWRIRRRARELHAKQALVATAPPVR
jgi:dolichyl-phosphate beta-glucosyltransferase